MSDPTLTTVEAPVDYAATSVLQPWVMVLPRRHQGVLLGAARGCDTALKPGPGYEGEGGPERHLTAFLRYCFMVPADERELDVPGAYMRLDPPKREDWKPSQLGHFPQHYYAHLMHAFQVVGYCHPDTWTRGEALDIYYRMAVNMHLFPESLVDFNRRLTEDRIASGKVVS